MEKVLLSDARVFEIPTNDNGEPLVCLVGHHGDVLVDDTASSDRTPHAFEFWCRSGACTRLISAAQKLPRDYRFLLKETIRPASVQAEYFQRSLDRARQRNPGASGRQIMASAAKYTAPPQVAGHPTGGAIDITLADSHGRELDLGCPYDDDEVKTDGRCFSDAQNITTQAKQHRAILFDALNGAGFVNYPFEWWHWSYGDKYWALAVGNPFAIYGVAL